MKHLKTISQPPARAFSESDLSMLMTVLTFVSEIVVVFVSALGGKDTAAE